MSARFLAVAFASLLLPAMLCSQGLVIDLMPGFASGSNGSSSPLTPRIMNGVIYFSAYRSNVGQELWRSDGTYNGTWPITDIAPGSASSSPNMQRVVGNALFFVAAPTSNTLCVYRSDGTMAGTVAVTPPFAFYANASNPFAVWDDLNGVLLFGGQTQGQDGVWRAAASGGPATLCSNACTSAYGFTRVGSLVYFAASTAASGSELWCTDGTAAGTRQVAEIMPGTGSAGIHGITAGAGVAYFTANDGVHGREVWCSSGTANTTHLVCDVRPGAATSTPDNLTVSGGLLYFSADDGVHGNDLWRSDGTSAGTTCLDLEPGPGSSYPGDLLDDAASNQLLLQATDSAHGTELWRTDGSAAGTWAIELAPGVASSNPYYFMPAAGVVYFQATTAAAGTELWRTDGTAAGTNMVADIEPGSGNSNPISMRDWNGGVLFIATTTVTGRELFWLPPSGPPQVLVDIIAPPALSSWPQDIFGMRGRACFAATPSTTGMEVFTSDGTTAGTHLVADYSPGSASGAHLPGAVVGDRLFLFGTNPGYGSELCVSDGGSYVHLVIDLAPGSITGAVGSTIVPLHDGCAFVGNDGQNGTEVYYSDGTASGTVLLSDANPGNGWQPITSLASDGESLWFTAGYALWRSDGTPAGTVRLLALPGQSGPNPRETTPCRGGVLFCGNDTAHGQELWFSDGTTAGTSMLMDIVPGSGGSAPTRFTVVGNQVFFVAPNPPWPSELWITDGTPAGTHPVQQQPTESLQPNHLVAHAGSLYFLGHSAACGRELWVSDGTDAGTRQVVDLRPGAGDGAFDLAAAGLAHVALVGNDGASGDELWISDGTATGTHLLVDAEPGASSASPTWIKTVGTQLFWSATTLMNGSELWAAPLQSFGGAAVVDYGDPCQGTNGTPGIAGAGVPVIGSNGFTLQLDTAPPLAPAAALLDLQPTAIALGTCSLLVAPMATVIVLADVQGRAALPLPIPHNPLLVGVSLYAQFLVADAGGGLLGIGSSTAGLRVLIGR